MKNKYTISLFILGIFLILIIYLSKYNHKEFIKFTIDGAVCVSPTYNKKLLYYGGGEDTDSINKLIEYNIETNERKVLYHSSFENSIIGKIMINDEWILWVENATINDNKYVITIYAMEKTDSKITTVYECESEKDVILSPRLYKNYVSWISNDKNVPTVEMFDLSKNELNEISKLNEYGLFNTFIHIYDDKIIWSDINENIGIYNIYNIKSHNTKHIKSNYKFLGYTQMSRSNLYSINFDNFENWMDQEFGCMNIETQIYTKLKSSYINGFRVNKDYLVILNSSNGVEIFEIYNNYKRIKIDIGNVDTMELQDDNYLLTTKGTGNSIQIQIINISKN